MSIIEEIFNAITLFIDSGSKKWGIRHYVCNYGTGGNTQGARIFTSGKPCSKCPSGTSCKGGLCSKAKRNNEIPEETFPEE